MTATSEPLLLLRTWLAGLIYYDGVRVLPAVQAPLSVALRHESDNPVDPHAVSIWSDNGDKLGYVPRSASRGIARRLDEGLPLLAVLESWEIESRNFISDVTLAIFSVAENDFPDALEASLTLAHAQDRSTQRPWPDADDGTSDDASAAKLVMDEHHPGWFYKPMRAIRKALRAIDRLEHGEILNFGVLWPLLRSEWHGDYLDWKNFVLRDLRASLSRGESLSEKNLMTFDEKITLVDRAIAHIKETKNACYLLPAADICDLKSRFPGLLNGARVRIEDADLFVLLCSPVYLLEAYASRYSHCRMVLDRASVPRIRRLIEHAAEVVAAPEDASSLEAFLRTPHVWLVSLLNEKITYWENAQDWLGEWDDIDEYQWALARRESISEIERAVLYFGPVPHSATARLQQADDRFKSQTVSSGLCIHHLSSPYAHFDSTHIEVRHTRYDPDRYWYYYRWPGDAPYPVHLNSETYFRVHFGIDLAPGVSVSRFERQVRRHVAWAMQEYNQLKAEQAFRQPPDPALSAS